MSKVYLLRHQAHGYVTEFPFANPPSEEQTEAVRRFCFQLHGFGHPKTPTEPYYLKLVELDCLGPNDVPEVPERALSLSKENVANSAAPTASGVGTVTNPKEG